MHNNNEVRKEMKKHHESIILYQLIVMIFLCVFGILCVSLLHFGPVTVDKAFIAVYTVFGLEFVVMAVYIKTRPRLIPPKPILLKRVTERTLLPVTQPPLAMSSSSVEAASLIHILRVSVRNQLVPSEILDVDAWAQTQ
jgi:hypothetical protein